MTGPGSSVLLVTAPPGIFGGVAVQTRGLARFLRARGYRVTIAHYAALRTEGDLTVPVHRLLTGQRPGVRRYKVWDGFDCVAIGCRLPELEVTYYGDSQLWRDVISAHDRHIAVGGNALVSAPLAAAGLPHLVWCASDVRGDRVDRQNAMSFARRLFDRNVVSPLLRRLERRVLDGPGTFATISNASARSLDAIGAGAGKPFEILPIPVDPVRFSPPITPPDPGIVGIAGRHTDPRKNAGLAFQAVADARNGGANISLRVAGDVSDDLREKAAGLGIGDAVEFLGTLNDEDLPEFYRGLDMFLIPSRQEGLNIAGLEAGACGVPVITTRCGGPEDYAIDGETGFVTGFDPAEIAGRLIDICVDRELRDKLSLRIRSRIAGEYGDERFTGHLDRIWRSVWNEPLSVNMDGAPRGEQTNE
ncbi:MAG: glycosyltransferase involved in cell wall biosynthesis [Paracoccaceae bacterium]|jgi:glycosyltransferase involved in cell wall biosynthesis